MAQAEQEEAPEQEQEGQEQEANNGNEDGDLVVDVDIIPQLIAIITILSLKWGKGANLCHVDRLELWLIVYAIRRVLSLVSSRLVAMFGNDFVCRALLGPWCLFLDLFWLALGSVWLSQEPAKTSWLTCSIELYLLTLSILIFNAVVYILLPLLLLCILFLATSCLPSLFHQLVLVRNSLIPGEGPASEELIAQIPLQTYSPALAATLAQEPDQQILQCAICLQTYQDNQAVRLLPCHRQHHFHRTCVDRWLRRRNSCPLCRTALTAAE